MTTGVKVQNQTYSANDVNRFCNELNKLGNRQHEWLNVHGAFPITSGQSRALLSRFWKPKHLRLHTALNKTLAFFKENKKALMDPQYVKKNIESVEHIVNYFSTKNFPNLPLWEFRRIIDEMNQVEEPLPQETPETILEKAQQESSKRIKDAEDQFENVVEQCVKQKRVSQQEYDAQKEITENMQRDVASRGHIVVKRLGTSKPIDTKFISERRTSSLKNSLLHDVRIVTKTLGGELTTHSIFLKSVLKNPQLIQEALDLFKNYCTGAALLFCNRLYRADRLICDRLHHLKSREYTLVEYAEYMEMIQIPSFNFDSLENQKITSEFALKIDSAKFISVGELYLYLLKKYPNRKDNIDGKLKEKFDSSITTFKEQITFFNYVAAYDLPLEQKTSFILEHSLLDISSLPNIVQQVDAHLIEEMTKHLDALKDVDAHFKKAYYVLLLNQEKAQPKDLEEAFNYLQKETDLFLRYQVALCYMEGKGVIKNEEEAVEILFQLTQQGVVHQILETLLIRRGIVDDKFITFFEHKLRNSRLFNEEEGNAYLKVAEAYLKGNGCTQNLVKAKKILKDILAFSSLSILANLRMRASEMLEEIPVEYFIDEAIQGHYGDRELVIRCFLKNISESGKHITPNTLKWIQEWANDKSCVYTTQAKFVLGTCYLKGYGAGQKRIEDGIKWIQISMDDREMRLLGCQVLNEFCLENPTDPNVQRAKSYILEHLFENPTLVEKKPFCNQETMIWMLNCAQDKTLLNSERAMCCRARWIVGLFYYHGYGGVQINKSTARDYFIFTADYDAFAKICKDRISLMTF